MIQHNVFEPILGGRTHLKSTKLPLDHDTPRGVYQGKDESCYLVCDHRTARYAVVLKHTDLEEFTCLDLGGSTFDEVNFIGDGRMHLGERDEWFDDRYGYEGQGELGEVTAYEGVICMFVKDKCGEMHWRTVMRGWSNAGVHRYQDWSLVNEFGRAIFGRVV